MGLYFGRRRSVGAPELVVRAQAGDPDAREQLIRDFTPFIMKTASQAAGRYLRPGVDEEISIGLLAFNEAIDAYRDSKGSFLQFAQTVIRRRMVDYFRRDRRRFQELPLEVDPEAGEESRKIAMQVDRAAQHAWEREQEGRARSAEIEEFQTALANFGIEFGELVKLSPKHADARQRAMAAARLVSKDELLRRYLWEHKALPLKAMEGALDRLGMSRKTIERHRRYIVAIAVLLGLDTPYLHGYLEGAEE